MTSDSTPTPAFDTAIAKGTFSPIKVPIRGVELDDDGEPKLGKDKKPIPIEVVLRIDPKLDMLRATRIIAAFRSMSQIAIAKDTKSITEGADFDKLDEMLDDMGAAMSDATTKAREAFRKFIVPPDRADWDRVADQVDMFALIPIVQYVIGELSGSNPTQPRSSSAD